MGGTRVGDRVSFDLGGGAHLTLGLRVDTGPTGNARLTPTLGVELGNANTRIEAVPTFRDRPGDGLAMAFPQFGIWAASGNSWVPGAQRYQSGRCRAETLRLGFALDAQRRLTFVLAADGVILGTHTYPTLDLTSPDAVMDVVGNTVGDVRNELLANCGSALDIVRILLGLDAPAGSPQSPYPR